MWSQRDFFFLKRRLLPKPGNYLRRSVVSTHNTYVRARIDAETKERAANARSRGKTIGSIHTLLLRLAMNRQFVENFLSADMPFFAIGVIEERKIPCGFLTLRTAETSRTIPLCTILSSKHVTPSGLSLSLPGFDIYTRRTGCGMYAILCNRSSRFASLVSRFPAYSSLAAPSGGKTR